MPDYFRDIAPLAFLIMGVSGSGKSTLGVELARAIGCAFLDGDTFHTPTAIAKMRSGHPLTDEDRWPWLDRLGGAVDAEIAEKGIAVAACSALRKAYRDRLRNAIKAPICFVLLDVEQQELLRRLSSRSGHYMPPSLLSSQLDTLERPTSDECVITLDARQTPSQLRDQILTQVINSMASK
ncbi:MAG: gluconokinase [Rhizomicrobium sp.]|nr:gluconokinase [Rhizomicrobium sp.]